jgi:hypothetical protein
MTATMTESTLVVTDPLVLDDLPVEQYHADPVAGGSLSCSGAKKLLPPSCPAIFDYERTHPPESTATFDIGHAAHQRVLGVGPEIVVVPGERWDTNEAKAKVAEAREAGQIPVKADVMAQVDGMAAALHKHPIASALLSDGGHPESSLFWRDEPSGIIRRARLDWRPAPKTGRTVACDYKTAKSSNPDEFAKSAANYGYDLQAAWYIDGLIACGLADSDAQFVFICQMKTPPYLVSVAQLTAYDMRIARHRNREAIDVYATCRANDHWPSFADDEVVQVALPYWHQRQYEDVL